VRYKNFLLILILLPALYSCKKQVPKPAPVALIVGKWLPVNESSELYYNGVQIDSVRKTRFSTDDFVQYYSDGTGYYSKSSPTGPSLSEFTYVVSGKILTQYYNAEHIAVPGTITDLTTTSFSVHIIFLVSDPNNPGMIDTEIDDFTYKK
jgi:hypothetical protein